MGGPARFAGAQLLLEERVGRDAFFLNKLFDLIGVLDATDEGHERLLEIETYQIKRLFGPVTHVGLGYDGNVL